MKKELKDLARTTKAAVNELVKTGKLMSKDPEHRMKTCQACECYKNHRCSRDVCKDGCNCYMPVKVKLHVATCPRKKW